ncbi:T6SS effector BTH_I2691 family protein [Burkholderia pyrrocinia]|uniref:T6SS effector BTH_I2691 family protein n=1 Tax=Burkholderia pyrrocinia TaxID=60550 RepID=UPI00064BBA03|nr:T6SS effector BTH_I2691 family protein [Burkholderia pyrrocinia]AKM03758.1 hypothetical protein ABD05_27150 [Burkholderia pyrrocinia]
MAANNQKCANCEKTGLPILPVRYAVLPKTVKAKMPAGIVGDRVTTVGLTEHQYGLRTLRDGWLYLLYEVGARGTNYWEAYKVTEDGRFWKQSLPLPSVPTTHPACAKTSIAVPMDVIAIEQPELCTGKVYIAFSQHAWHPRTFDKYEIYVDLRKQRMQWIEPSKWVPTGKDGTGHAIVATESSINDVLEYMPGLDAKQLCVLDDKQRFTADDGSYREDLLARVVSRYPLNIRQASPASASQSLVKMMGQVGKHDAGGGATSSTYPPMLLALWDAVGNVHELNGFRNDPVSWLDRYGSQQELGMKVMALNDVDTAKRIVDSRTGQNLATQEAMAKEAHAMTPLGSATARAGLAAQRARALAGADAARAQQVNAYYDDLDWMAANNIPGSYQTRIIQIGRFSSAGSASSSMPYLGKYRDEVMNDARKYAKAQPGFHDRNLDRMQKSEWSRYEARLQRKQIEDFRTPYKKLQNAVFQLQETRSNDVGKWLRTPLLADTLDDYYCDDLSDSFEFEVVVAMAIDGLGSTPKGLAILDDLIGRWKPTDKESIVWRAVAMNHPAGREELEKLLASALEHKDTPLEDDGVKYVVTAVKYIGKLTDYYKKYSKLALETNPAKISYLGAMYKEQGRDVLLMNIGDRVFEKLRINKLGDFVGEKIVQTLFLQRAGVPVEDALALVRKQALYDKVSRSEILQRFRTARTVLSAPAKAGANPTTELYEVWDKLKADKDANALKELRLGRIAVIAALCELVNFWHLLSEAKDEDTTAKLIKSGASLSAAIITIAMTPYYGTLKKSVRTMGWKMVGGFLSGAGAFAAAWLDYGATRKSLKSGQYDVMWILVAKTMLGVASGTAFVIDAISTAAPLFKTLAARSGNRVVVMAVEAVASRVAVVASLRVVSMLITWEATIGLLALQVLADVLTPDELESWCSRCVFGTGQEAILRVKDHSVAKYTDMAQQEKAFEKAMTEMA